MRTKDEVCVKIKNFITFNEHQMNKKALKSDNRLEYLLSDLSSISSICWKPMQQMLIRLDIKHERTNYYSPSNKTEWQRG